METKSSGNDAKAFLDAIDANGELQNKLQQATSNLVEAGKEHGFEFTQEQLHDELRDRWEISKPKDDPDTCTVTVI